MRLEQELDKLIAKKQDAVNKESYAEAHELMTAIQTVKTQVLASSRFSCRYY